MEINYVVDARCHSSCRW